MMWFKANVALEGGSRSLDGRLGCAGGAMSISTAERPPLLAVDDYEGNLVVVSALLEPLGFEVITAVTAFEAIALARERAFAAILLDVRMPTLNGDDALAFIRRSAANAETPVLFVSGDEVLCEKLRLQGHAVLEKPYRGAKLIECVRALMDRSPPESLPHGLAAMGRK